MLNIVPIPAFHDNYIWLIHNNRCAIVVDPGEADAVLGYLAQHDLTLAGILNTHHHHDHVGGNLKLVRETGAPIYGPATETIPALSTPLKAHDKLRIAELAVEFAILPIPGHTLGHIAYYGSNYLFCGDTLFACGCGRLFEGTPQQMVDSLAKLAALPAATNVYCGHEYTLDNIRFARSIDPENKILAQREQNALDLRAKGQPTLPSRMDLELATNPFLRCHTAEIRSAASHYRGRALTHPVDVFAAIRELKNRFV